MKRIRNALLLLLLTVLGITTLNACNTMEGVGRDIESAGESISDAADG